jgi:hypothetical protein
LSDDEDENVDNDLIDISHEPEEEEDIGGPSDYQEAGSDSPEAFSDHQEAGSDSPEAGIDHQQAGSDSPEDYDGLSLSDVPEDDVEHADDGCPIYTRERITATVAAKILFKYGLQMDCYFFPSPQ